MEGGRRLLSLHGWENMHPQGRREEVAESTEVRGMVIELLIK